MLELRGRGAAVLPSDINSIGNWRVVGLCYMYLGQKDIKPGSTNNSAIPLSYVSSLSCLGPICTFRYFESYVELF